MQEELALAAQRIAAAETEAARREAEAERCETEAVRHETETTQQWQELMFKVLEHRFPSVPMALILLLQAVKPAQRSRVSDIILDSPDVDSCLQALRQLQAEA